MFSAASGIRSCQFDRKRDCSLAESQTRISNVEQGMSNIEGRNSIEFYGFKRQSATIPPFVILRFEILLFCGSLFDHAESHTREEKGQRHASPSWKILFYRKCGIAQAVLTKESCLNTET